MGVSNEDLESAALEGIWQAIEQMPEDCDNELRFVVAFAHRRVIDVIRAVRGRSAENITKREFARRIEFDEFRRRSDVIADYGYVELMLSLGSLNLTEREEQVIELLASGYARGEAARILGVDPARITQLCYSIQKKMANRGLDRETLRVA